VGFFYSGAFGKPGKVVHLATGLLGLALWRSYFGARAYAIGLGVVYTAVAIWGFVIGSGESILGFLPINTEDNVLHLLIALAGLMAGVAAGPTPRPSVAGTEPGTSFRELRT
jgi:hypothetical protein